MGQTLSEPVVEKVCADRAGRSYLFFSTLGIGLMGIIADVRQR